MKSPAAKAEAPGALAYSSAIEKAPAPLFTTMLISLEASLATSNSKVPSSFISAIASPNG